jgi:hypothetical protein
VLVRGGVREIRESARGLTVYNVAELVPVEGP